MNLFDEEHVPTPDEIKDTIRVRLTRMAPRQLAYFICELDLQLGTVGIALYAQLMNVGLVVHAFADLTPYQLAHLARFLRMNSPRGFAAFETAYQNVTGHSYTSPLTEGSGNALPRTGRRAARPYQRR